MKNHNLLPGQHGRGSKMKAFFATLALLGVFEATQAQNKVNFDKIQIDNYYTNPEMVDNDFFPKINKSIDMQSDDLQSLIKFRDAVKDSKYLAELKVKLLRKGEGNQHQALRQIIEGVIGEYLYLHETPIYNNNGTEINLYDTVYVPIITTIFGEQHVKSERALLNTFDSEVIKYQFSVKNTPTEIVDNQSTRLLLRIAELKNNIDKGKDLYKSTTNLVDLFTMYYKHRRYIRKNADIQENRKTIDETDPITALTGGNSMNINNTTPNSQTVDIFKKIARLEHYINNKDEAGLKKFRKEDFFKWDRKVQEEFLLKYYVYTNGETAIENMSKYEQQANLRIGSLLEFIQKLEYAEDMDLLLYRYVQGGTTISIPMKEYIRNQIQKKLEDPTFKKYHNALSKVASHFDNPTEPINIQYGDLAMKGGINDAGMKHIFEEFLSSIPLDWKKTKTLPSKLPIGSAVQDGFILLYPENIQVLGSQSDDEVADNNRDNMLAEFLAHSTTQQTLSFDQLSYIRPDILTNLVNNINKNNYVKNIEFNFDLLRPNYSNEDFVKVAQALSQLNNTKKLSIRTSGESVEVLEKLVTTKAVLEYLTDRLSEDEHEILLTKRTGSLLLPITENVTKNVKFGELFKKYMDRNKSNSISFSLGDYATDEDALKAMVSTTREAKKTHTITFTNLQIGDYDDIENLRRIDANLVLLSYPDKGTATILQFGSGYEGRGGDHNDLFLGSDSLTVGELDVLQNNYLGETRGTNQKHIGQDLTTILSLGKDGYKKHKGNATALDMPKMDQLPSKKNMKKLQKAGYDEVTFGAIKTLDNKGKTKKLIKFKKVNLPELNQVNKADMKTVLKKSDHGFSLTTDKLGEDFFDNMKFGKGNDTIDIRNVQTINCKDGTIIDFSELLPDIRNKNVIKIMDKLYTFEQKGGKVILNSYFNLIYSQYISTKTKK